MAAGLRGPPLDMPAQRGLRIYVSLSPAQREKARSAGGLAYQELTPAQRELIAASSAVWGAHVLPDAEIARAVYRVTQSGFTFKLAVEFPSREVQTTLELRPVAPEPAATAGP